MIATLSRVENTTQYQVSNLRSFDAWGAVRSGTSTGAPSQRYCASLGHVQDDESSLIYMRARYYEPWTGRFVSEDSAKDGSNWFTYCGNEPAGRADVSGQSWEDLRSLLQTPLFQATVTAFNLAMLFRNAMKGYGALLVAASGLIFLAAWFGGDDAAKGGALFAASLSAMYGLIVDLGSAGGEMTNGVAAKAVALAMNYSIILGMFIRLEIWEEGL